MSTKRCPDCDGPDLSSFFSYRQNGKCSNCHGKGEIYGIREAIYSIVSFSDEPETSPCEVCSGTGQCQTCGGTGEVEDNCNSDD